MTPPAGLWLRLRYYSRHYGVVHALARYFFSRWLAWGWPWMGALVTGPFMRKWVYREGRKVLNLGGGGNCLDGCLTVDVDPRADCWMDLRRPLPLANASVDAIFCEEFIEHIRKEDGRQLLIECIRVLKPSGTMRITTPDLDYLAETMNLAEGGADRINAMFYEHGHRYLYTRRALREVCEATGFVNFGWSRYRDPSSVLGHLDSHADRFDHDPSLAQYAEMQKPS